MSIISVLNKYDHPGLYSALKQHTEKYLERNCPSLVGIPFLSFVISEFLFPKENTNLNLLLGTIWTRVVPCWIFTKLGGKAFMIIFHFRVVPDLMIIIIAATTIIIVNIIIATYSFLIFRQFNDLCL